MFDGNMGSAESLRSIAGCSASARLDTVRALAGVSLNLITDGTSR